ncbi:MAG: PQQ-dependent sugar dehydrogenase [Phycisphaerae bacterium]|nr:PQQ-dependent sugar dehydrogenase [Phycisphaerae bacterium]
MSRMGTRLCCAAALAGGALLLVGCPPFSGQTAIPINVAAGLRAEYVVSNAAHPTALAFTPDGRVFYTEKNTGQIRVIADGTLLEQPFAAVPVNCAGDRGLLGLAAHPNFNLNQRIYIFYTRSDTGLTTDDPQAFVDNRIAYFVADGDVASGGEVFVVSLPAEGNSRRVGGQIGFAPDGKLFVALGDLNDENNAQDAGVLAGKILRYNDDGSIPADNPTADSPVYARGLRHPRGLGFDPGAGTAFVADRCSKRYHELNRIEAGKNYGWPAVSGLATTAEELQFAEENPDYVDPILDSGHDTSPLVGVAFNPSTKYGPDNLLYLFYGVREEGRVFSLELSGDRTAAVKSRNFANGFPTPMTDVVFTPAGTLYVLSENAILRVVTYP